MRRTPYARLPAAGLSRRAAGSGPGGCSGKCSGKCSGGRSVQPMHVGQAVRPGGAGWAIRPCLGKDRGLFRIAPRGIPFLGRRPFRLHPGDPGPDGPGNRRKALHRAASRAGLRRRSTRGRAAPGRSRRSAGKSGQADLQVRHASLAVTAATPHGQGQQEKGRQCVRQQRTPQTRPPLPAQARPPQPPRTALPVRSVRSGLHRDRRAGRGYVQCGARGGAGHARFLFRGQAVTAGVAIRIRVTG